MTRNVVYIDMKHIESWGFLSGLENTSGIKWEVKSYVSNQAYLSGKYKGKFSGIIRYIRWFYYSFLIFFNRKKYSNIIAWQQFYGLLFVLYCKLFRAKKTFTLIVMTFIYKRKGGFAGRIYESFIKYVVNSRFIDKIIVYSSKEVDYYSHIFESSASKFVSIPLGIEQIKGTVTNNFDEGSFILSVGRSNRDYPFLIEALKESEFKVKILSDKPFKTTSENIEIYNDVCGEDMFAIMRKCFCVVIPLDNPNISAGQLVILQAMQLGKPVIVTESNGIADYIKNNYNGFIINKSKDDLINAIMSLYSSKELYYKISVNGIYEYENKYSTKQMGVNVGKILKFIK